MRRVRVLRRGTLAELTPLRDDWRRPRADIVEESEASRDCFHAVSGPFSHYERRLRLRPATRGSGDDNRTSSGGGGDSKDARGGDTGTWELSETTTYRLAIPVWGWVFWWPVRQALRRRRDSYGYWWAPPDRLDARQAHVLAVLCTAQVVDGYLGTVLTQTLTFAADEFGHGNTAQGTVLAVVRTGVLLALAAMAVADRRGRRHLLAAVGVGSCAATAVGALSPQLWVLGASQLLARGLATALGVLIVIVATEEMPARARAWAASVLALCAGLGSGMAVWVLPVADLHLRAWRAVYVVPTFGIAVFAWVSRQLPESIRFMTAVEAAVEAAPDEADPDEADPDEAAGLDADTSEAVRQRRQQRLVLLACAAFLVAIFAAPASSLQNDFLKDERGFSAAGISLFTVVTSTPVGIGILIGGYLADRRGRKPVGATGLAFGAAATLLAYFSSGPALWLLAVAGSVFAGLAVPALAVYGPELFGTAVRARANGVVVTVGVLGSASGLFAAGWVSDALGGRLGPALALLVAGPLAVAALVVTRFPETAGVELADLNPEDQH